MAVASPDVPQGYRAGALAEDRQENEACDPSRTDGSPEQQDGNQIVTSRVDFMKQHASPYVLSMVIILSVTPDSEKSAGIRNGGQQ